MIFLGDQQFLSKLLLSKRIDNMEAAFNLSVTEFSFLVNSGSTNRLQLLGWQPITTTLSTSKDGSLIGQFLACPAMAQHIVIENKSMRSSGSNAVSIIYRPLLLLFMELFYKRLLILFSREEKGVLLKINGVPEVKK